MLMMLAVLFGDCAGVTYPSVHQASLGPVFMDTVGGLIVNHLKAQKQCITLHRKC